MFMGPSWEVPWVLGNPGILGQGGKLVCSVFLGQRGKLVCSVFVGPSWEFPWKVGSVLGVL